MLINALLDTWIKLLFGLFYNVFLVGWTFSGQTKRMREYYNYLHLWRLTKMNEILTGLEKHEGKKVIAISFFFFLAELSLSETIIDVMYYAPVVSIVMIVTLTKDGCSLNTYSKHPQRCTHTTHASSKSDPNLSVSPFTQTDSVPLTHCSQPTLSVCIQLSKAFSSA